MIDSTAIRLDSLLLRNRDSASVLLRGFVRRFRRIGSRDLRVTRSAARPERAGAAASSIERPRRPEPPLSGTKLAPLINGDATLSAIRWVGSTSTARA